MNPSHVTIGLVYAELAVAMPVVGGKAWKHISSIQTTMKSGALQSGVDVARGPEDTSIYLTLGSVW